eukprot:m.201961 g.201961  ORF g.201961 m.201961 type:complete len:59 (+) comp32807_c8_seq2:441-617(+)
MYPIVAFKPATANITPARTGNFRITFGSKNILGITVRTLRVVTNLSTMSTYTYVLTYR